MAMDCRSFDPEAYSSEILSERKQQFSTIFSVVFISTPSASGVDEDYLAASYSSGLVSLFRVKDLTSKWLGRQHLSGSPCLSWKAHDGPVYCIMTAIIGASQPVLVTGGDDGKLKVWDVHGGLLPHCTPKVGADAARCAPYTAQLAPTCEMAIPRAEGIFLGWEALPPGIVTISFDEKKQLIYVGATDGGLYAFDLFGLVASFRGHAASIATTNFCPTTSTLASGSEDGTVRLWDCSSLSSRPNRTSAAPASATPTCTHIINPWDGVELPLNATPNELLQCFKSPHVTTLRFDRDGGWLVIGTGNAALTLWSLTLGQCAQQLSTNSVPQAICILPGEILVACSQATLFKYKFSIEQPPTCIEVGARSCFALDTHPQTGMVAIGGSGGRIDLLSPYGAKLGAVFPNSVEE